MAGLERDGESWLLRKVRGDENHGGGAILSEDRIPPEGVSYDSLIANVIDPSVSELEIKLPKFLEKENNKFSVSVLQGTTGSGKTLVYFERIKNILKKNNQALVLLPEIFLTNDFKSRFEDFFGFEPAIWHSKITPKNKRIIWKGVINNQIKIVVGARSSLLLPFKNLGVIIVDEEHDTSYKQDEGIIYHARDMAISRASFEKIPINLV